jgi:hypothetical protein
LERCSRRALELEGPRFARNSCGAAARDQSEPQPDATKQTARERYAAELARNPRCKEAAKTGRGVIIGGAKPPS